MRLISTKTFAIAALAAVSSMLQASLVSGEDTNQGLVTLDMLNKAVPAAAATDYCTKNADKKYPKECVNNAVAVASINKALTKYKVTRRADIVAVVAWMAFESGSWKYTNAHFPKDVPGIGTRTIMAWANVASYAKYLYSCRFGVRIGEFAKDVDKATDAVKVKVLKLVNGSNDDAFGAGFWYFVNGDAKSYYQGKTIKDGDYDSFKDFMVKGVKAPFDEKAYKDRKDVWDKVNAGIVFAKAT